MQIATEADIKKDRLQDYF